MTQPAELAATRGPIALESTWLERFPIQMFGVVMGLGGLGNAWRLAARVWDLPPVIGTTLVRLAGLVFTCLLLVLAAKLLRYRAAVAAEFRHPVKSNFFGAISVSAIIMSIAFRDAWPDVARAFWVAGAAFHFILAVTFMRRWVLEQQDEAEMTPAWFIPIAGNFLVPVGGVPLGFVETSWFFFSVALVFWVVLFTIAMHRVVFCAPMSERSVPTLFILLAPPSIGLSAYFAFTGGEAGPLAHILYCFGVFVAILIGSLANRFLQVHYFLSWWAMTFPSSAWAGACIAYYKAHPTPATALVASLALFVASALLGVVFIRTMVALRQGTLLHE
jgi:tellurite resistance protein